MALAALSGDEQCIIFSQLCNAHARHSVPGRLAGCLAPWPSRFRVQFDFPGHFETKIDIP